MSIVVQKYGGSSVATIEKMRQIALRIKNKKNQGNAVVVVVSAMGKTTNQLIEMAKEASRLPSKRELDLLMATGEQVSISLLSLILNEMGEKAIALTGAQAGIKTDGNYTKSLIKDLNIGKVKQYLDEGYIVVVAGFQGMNDDGEVTTLGRGGSDTTAVALAAKLECPCEIYTDVTGIYSVDPRDYPQAKQLNQINYEEMQEMSSLGAKVMESRSVELGHRFQVPIYVASSQQDIEGTWIKEINEMEQRSVTGLSINDHVLMITLNHVIYNPNNIAMIFCQFAKQDINVDMISQTSPIDGYVNLSFTISSDDFELIDDVLNHIVDKIPEVEVVKDMEIIKLSVVGSGMRNQTGVAAKIFQLFADELIEFKQVTTSEISISYTIHKQDRQRAIDKIATAFSL